MKNKIFEYCHSGSNLSKFCFFLLIITTCILASEYYRSTTITYNLKTTKFNSTKQNILILGDSISMGYTPKLTELLSQKTNIVRPVYNPYSFIPIAYTNFHYNFSRKSPLLGLPKIHIHIDLENGRAINCGGTLNAIKNIEQWINGKHYDIIHVNFGIWDTRNITTHEYHKNIEKLILKIKPHTISIVLATTTPVDDIIKNNKIIQFNNSIKILANKHNVIVNDLYKTAVNNSLFRIDGTHYSDEGYTILAKTTENILRQNLLQNMPLLQQSIPYKKWFNLTSNRTL